MKKLGLVVLGLIIALLAIYLIFIQLLSNKATAPAPTSGAEAVSNRETASEDSNKTTFTFSAAKKSAHYVSNSPAHEEVLATQPGEVTIAFNFDVAPPSSITITKDGRDVGSGETSITADKLHLQRKLNPIAGDGLYTVTYNACWPDGSCHDGHFQFAVNKQ